jgi:hypothetical protein
LLIAISLQMRKAATEIGLLSRLMCISSLEENEMQNVLKVSTVALAMILSGLTLASAQQANEPVPGAEALGDPGQGH